MYTHPSRGGGGGGEREGGGREGEREREREREREGGEEGGKEDIPGKGGGGAGRRGRIFCGYFISWVYVPITTVVCLAKGNFTGRGPKRTSTLVLGNIIFSLFSFWVVDLYLTLLVVDGASTV